MDEVIRSGPLFDGRAIAEGARFAVSLEDAIGREAENRIHQRLGQVLQHPTGHYQGAIHTERAVADLVVTDTPVIYGPWLEGVGSRNKTTRFKGYSTFRMVGQQLDVEAVALSERELLDGGFLTGMGGLVI